MSNPLYSIPGQTQTAAAPAPAGAAAVDGARTVKEVLAQSQVEAVMDELDRDLIGLAPVKSRIRDIAALLVGLHLFGACRHVGRFSVGWECPSSRPASDSPSLSGESLGDG